MQPENQNQTPQTEFQNHEVNPPKKPKTLIWAVVLILILLVAGTVAAYFALNLEDKKESETQTSVATQNSEVEKVVYTKVVGKNEKSYITSDLIISNIDGSNKKVLVAGFSQKRLIFSPERSELISIDDIEKKIEIYSLLDGNIKSVFDLNDLKPGYYIGSYKLSPDQKKIVLSLSKTNFDGPSEVVLIDLEGKNIEPKIIYSYPYELVTPYWDSRDIIYGWRIRSAGTCGPSKPKLVINSLGQEVDPLFNIEEFYKHWNEISPDGNYFASFQENPLGPYFIGMCDFYANGIVKLYSTVDGSSIELENSSSKEYVFKQWTSDSKNLIYQINVYPEWSGDPKDVKVGRPILEGFISYNLDTREKEYFKNQEELDLWLKDNDPDFNHIVKFSENTSNENPDDKNLYVDGKLIDSIGTLPWSFGGPGFNVIGFMTVHGLVQEKSSASYTSDWQTYRNEEFGFEFKYPQDWTFGDPVDVGAVQVEKHLNNNISSKFEVWFHSTTISSDDSRHKAFEEKGRAEYRFDYCTVEMRSNIACVYKVVQIPIKYTGTSVGGLKVDVIEIFSGVEKEFSYQELRDKGFTDFSHTSINQALGLYDSFEEMEPLLNEMIASFKYQK